jgi:hypothetical protein
MTELLTIGVGGQKQNGKDTLADYLASKLTYTEEGYFTDTTEAKRTQYIWGRGSFAGAVKKIFCDAFDFKAEDIDTWKVLRDPPPGFDENVRKALTFIGDGFRKIKSNVWIERAFRGTEWHHKVFSDIRYINEARKVKSVGGFTILIHGRDGLNYDANRSEAELRPYISWCLSTGREGVIREWPEFKSLVEVAALDFSRHAVVGHMMANHDLYTEEECANNEVPRLDTFIDNLSQFDAFILNNGSIDFLYEKIDNMLVPTIKTMYPQED